jgi:hypothetical protein
VETTTAYCATISQTRVDDFPHAFEAMNMIARHGSDFGKVVADILVANYAHKIDSWWNLVGVLGAWNNMITIHVPYNPFLRNWLPLDVVSIAVGVVAIFIVPIVEGMVAIVAVVAVVDVHRSTFICCGTCGQNDNCDLKGKN